MFFRFIHIFSRNKHYFVEIVYFMYNFTLLLSSHMYLESLEFYQDGEDT